MLRLKTGLYFSMAPVKMGELPTLEVAACPLLKDPLRGHSVGSKLEEGFEGLLVGHLNGTHESFFFNKYRM